MQAKQLENLCVIGIGASVGGLEALLEFLPHLQANGKIAYVLAQHMALDGHSELIVRLLQRVTSLDVRLAQPAEHLLADCFYLLPAGLDGWVQQGRILLSAPKKDNFSTPSINLLFTALAEEYGARAIGIVLSGAGSDGVAGCRAIKAKQGLTIAQDPATAKFYGIPSAAIDAKVIHKVVHAKDIPHAIALAFPELAVAKNAKLQQLVHSPIPVHPPLKLQQLEQLLGLILQATNIDFSGYKVETLFRRLQRRMVNLGLEDIADYLGYISQNADELQVIQQLFLVSVSAFFRDHEAFEVLKEVMRSKLQANPKRKSFSIWVPGCASGEEVYTLAIMLAEILDKSLAEYAINILGTDLNTEVLNIARAGVYRKAAFKELDKNLLQRYFEQVGQDYKVCTEIRALCSFAKQDIIKGPGLTELDMVSCRNLLIYLKTQLQEQLFNDFYRCLMPQGILFMGPSESLSPKSTALFATIDHQYKIFQRR